MIVVPAARDAAVWRGGFPLLVARYLAKPRCRGPAILAGGACALLNVESILEEDRFILQDEVGEKEAGEEALAPLQECLKFR